MTSWQLMATRWGLRNGEQALLLSSSVFVVCLDYFSPLSNIFACCLNDYFLADMAQTPASDLARISELTFPMPKFFRSQSIKVVPLAG